MNEEQIRQLLESLEILTERMLASGDSFASFNKEMKSSTEATAATREERKKEKEAIIDYNNAARASMRESQEFQSKVNKELEKLGVLYGKTGALESQRQKQIEERKKLDKEIDEELEKNIKGYKDLSKAQKEKYQDDQKNKKAMDEALASTGRILDGNGKLVKQTGGLTQMQQMYIDTLKKSDDVQKNLLNNSTKLAADLGKMAIQNAFTMFTAGLKGAYEGTLAYQDAILESGDANIAAAAKVSAELNAMASALESTGSSMVSLGMEAGKTALEMIVLGGPIGVLVGIIGLLIGVTIAYEGYQKQSQAASMRRDAENEKKQAAIYADLIKDFTELSQASMTGAGGMTELWNQLNKVGMSVKEFGKFNSILKENAQAMAMFGAPAVEGVKKFTDVAGSVIKSGFGDVFRQMGITNEDMAAHTAKYMEQQSRLGLLKGKTDADLQKGTVKYIQELDKMAALTGVSRKEQEQNREAIKQITQLRAAQFMARKSGDTKEAERLKAIEDVAVQMQKFDPQAAAGFAKQGIGAAVDQDVAYSMRSGGTETLAAINAGERSTAKLIETFGEGMERFLTLVAPAMKVQGNISGFTGPGTGAYDLSERLAGTKDKKQQALDKGEQFNIDAFLEGQRKVTDAWTASQMAAKEAAGLAQRAMEHNVKANTATLGNPVNELLNKLPDKFQGPIREFMDAVTKFAVNVQKFAFDHPAMAAGIAAGAVIAYKVISSKLATSAAEKIEDRMVGKLSDALGKTGQTAGTTVGQTAGTVAQTAGTRMERIKQGSRYVMREVPIHGPAGATAGGTSGASIPGASSAASSSASEIIKTLAQPDILKNLGTGAGQGIAGFLKAFADPVVVLGAGGLGASIAAIIAGIGAGIAGASWIMGKALPTLMEGIKSFEVLDGKKLEAAGLGIGYLGTGLAVFGVGGVAGGIGSIVSNMSEGITSFFGGKTPIDKLVEFSKLDIDVEKTKNNSEAFVAFSKAMVAAGALSGIAGLGTLVGSISLAAASFFNGKTPIQQLLEFSKLDIDVPKTKNNAEAYVAFSKAFAESGLGAAAGGLGNLLGNFADGVSSFFGKKDIITKFVEFANLNIDPKKTKEMAEAFAAFAVGMASANNTSSSSGGSSWFGGGSKSASSGGSSGGGSSGGNSSYGSSGGGSSSGSSSGGGIRSYLPSWLGGTDNKNSNAYNFTSTNEGGQSAFNQVDSKLREALTAASGEYYAQTKRQVQIESSYRSPERQQRLWDESVKLGTPGRGPTGMTVAKPGTSPHEQGRAVDLANYNDPLLINTMAKYKIRQTEGPADPVHFQLTARNGGIFDGPNSGYPVQLHGREAIVPLPNPSDKIAIDKSQNSASNGSFGILPDTTTKSSSSTDSPILMELYSMMESKFDDLIDKMNTNNNYTNKILKYSMT